MEKKFFDWADDPELNGKSKVVNMPLTGDKKAEQEFQDLLDLVQQMNEHALAITPIDYESYLNELESMGVKVRRLK